MVDRKIRRVVKAKFLLPLGTGLLGLKKGEGRADKIFQTGGNMAAGKMQAINCREAVLDCFFFFNEVVGRKRILLCIIKNIDHKFGWFYLRLKFTNLPYFFFSAWIDKTVYKLCRSCV